MKHQRTIIAIVVGVTSSLALYYSNDALMATDPPSSGLSVAVIASAPMGMLISLLPGFVAGWISINKGLLAGFIAGALGFAIYALSEGAAQSYFTSGTNVPLGLLVFWFSLMCFVSGIFGASAGGAAQLVRSNNSSKPTPLRGAA